MTLEYIRYALAASEPDALLAAYVEAARSLEAAPECLGYDLSRCADDPRAFILRIRWVSVEAHMAGFRKGPHFPPFLAAIKPFIPEIAEMRHYTPTSLAWTRAE